MAGMMDGSRGGLNSKATEWVPPLGRERWKTADGAAMVAALRASGEEAAAFARRHGLKVARVQKWVKRLEAKSRQASRTVASTTVPFAPVRVTVERPLASGLEVVIGSAIVRIARGFDDELLRRVVATLGVASC